MAHFKLVTEHTFFWPVKIQIPSAKTPGKFDTQQITAQFKVIPRDELEQMQKEFEALETEEERAAHQDDVLRRAWIGWDESTVLDDDGQKVPFTEAARDQALQMPWVRIAAYEAYAIASSGGAARAKN